MPKAKVKRTGLAKLKGTKGHVTLYSEEWCEFVTQMGRLGCTEGQIADYMGISKKTLELWKREHPEFKQALREGRDLSDMHVVNALYEKALKGDTTAMIFWLKNRQPDRWRDRRDIDVKGKMTLEALVAGSDKIEDKT